MQLTKAVAELVPVLVACSGSPTNTVPMGAYIETKLVADAAGLGAASLDSNLLNPWGLAFGPTGILWVSNNHSGTSTLYDTTGAKRPLVVAIPTSGSATGGALAGAGYGAFSNDLLIGNFGDGRIGAYDPTSGSFIDFLRDTTSTPTTIEGLWGLVFGPNAAAPTLFFSSGPSGEAHGLLGTLRPK